MPRLTRSILHNDPTEPSAPEENIFVHGLTEAILKDPSPHLRQQGPERSPRPNYPALLQHTDSDSSDDDAVDIPYQNDEDMTSVVVDGTERTKQDPGPSVRVRTAAELEAIINAQVEDTSFSGLDTAGLPLLRNFMTSFERKFRDLHPERTELDWRDGVRKPARSAVARRAAQGQLCGVEVPADQKCTACAQGKSTFEHCRIVFVKNEAQWMWACANCTFMGGSHKCSFRPDLFSNVPSWVIAAVSERQPSSPLLQTYHGGKDTAATRKSAKSTTNRKRPAAVAQSNPEQIDQAPDLATHEYAPSRQEHSPTIQRAKNTSRVRGSAVSKGTSATPKGADEEQPAKRRKSEVGPAKAGEGATKDKPKRRKSEVGPTKPSEGATKDAPPKLKNGGLPFNTTWYNSPLEDPEVYRMKDKAYALDTYNDLAEIIARATEDHGRMKAALLKKGFLPESDDEESEEENVFAVE